MSLGEDSKVKKSKNRGLKAVPEASSHEATGGTFLGWQFYTGPTISTSNSTSDSLNHQNLRVLDVFERCFYFDYHQIYIILFSKPSCTKKGHGIRR